MIIGVTSSPNTAQEISVHIYNEARVQALEGAIVKMDIKGDLMIIAQLSNLKTANKWHENSQFAPIITAQGSLPFFTGSADVTVAKAVVLGAYKKEEGKWLQTLIGVPVGTGIKVEIVKKELIKKITEDTCVGNYYYVGRLFGADDSVAPVDLRHYGYTTDGFGHGEAYMGGVFGPSGSGKSVMTASLVSGFSRNKEMGILIIDPQGEFRLNKMNKPGFSFDFHRMLEVNSKGRFSKANALSIEDIQIDDVDAFVEVLRYYGFVKRFSKGKHSEVYEELSLYLEKMRKKVNIYKDWNEISKEISTLKDDIINIVSIAYSQRDKKKEELHEKWDDDVDFVSDVWDRSVLLFKEGTKYKVDKIVEDVLTRGKIFILDISADNYGLGDNFKKLILNYIMKKMRSVMYAAFRKSLNNTNALIVIDEAHLFAGNSEERGSISDDLSKTLTQGVAMMRKLNCGVMLCTQFITQIKREIFRQLHYRVYATGLIGPDREFLKEKEGDEGLVLYENLPDPKKSGKYCYMIGGNLGCLGNTGKPLIIEGYKTGDIELKGENIC